MKSTRNTVAKTKITELIDHSDIALSSTEILHNLDGLCDKVTVYRVLDRLIEEGGIHKIVNVDGTVKYAKCHSCAETHHHNHLHFSCDVCKSVTCLEDVLPAFSLSKKYKINEMYFMVSGVCPNCN